MPKDHFQTLCLYYMPESGPCRTVLLAARVLGIELNLKHVDLMKGEHLTKDFLKINPQHAVPTLTDNGFALSESRAIITYLCEKYGKKESLYPKDNKKRALINQRMFFDAATLYEPIVGCYRVVYYGAKSFDETKMPKIEQAFAFLDAFLAEEEFTAGSNLTLADIAIVSSVATARAVFDFDLARYKNVLRWYTLMKTTLPGFDEIIEENGNKLKKMLHHCMGTVYKNK